jgi:gamma-glutamyl:cysteine ligase YbdK (ATP-grasp superfamily)
MSTTTKTDRLHLFEGYGIELEYMIVTRNDLDVLPVSDHLLHDDNGGIVTERAFGEVAWSNELVLHVIELKTNGPAASLHGLAATFQSHVERINQRLERLSARLLPTGMHPWMDPRRETWIWPHDYRPIYDAYHRIFDCRDNGWANLQSTHINLPFGNDPEFARLHAAIRLVLPVLPALAASSPIVGGRVTGLLDNRLEVYRHNSNRIPSIAGQVIPEPVFTADAYAVQVLQKLYRDIAPHDPHGVLQHEWLNARGAIARFDRNAIEIRLVDAQECPAADVALAEAVVRVLKSLVAERWEPLDAQKAWPTGPLANILLDCIRDGEHVSIRDPAYLAMFGFPRAHASGRALWEHLVNVHFSGSSPDDAPFLAPLTMMVNRGPLARRILEATGRFPDRARLKRVYGELSACLAEGRLFDGRT